jgi:predicted nicotinamide N-methyase
MPDSDPDTCTKIRNTLSGRYDLAHDEISIGSRTFGVTRVDDTNALVDAIDPVEFAVDERLPYWAEIWASSIALAEWISEHAPGPGKEVLELGCGLGLPGIAAAATGARVTMTDYEDDALLFSRCNALENLDKQTVDARMRFVNLDWRDPNINHRYPLILGADIVYERKNFSALIALLRTTLAPTGLAVFSEPDRTVGSDFFRVASESGFHLERSARPARQHDRKVTVHIVVMRWKQEPT